MDKTKDTHDTHLNSDFTENAWDALYRAVDSPEFLKNDSETIYKALSYGLRPISFGDYLKRYILQKAGIDEPIADVELNRFRYIIRDSFSEHNTPPSFEPTTAKLSALSKNWLTQQTVSRKVVFLLGFGLGMSAEDVEMFLTKALREQGFNAKDPFEVICRYCFNNGYGYYKYESLWQEFLAVKADPKHSTALFDDATVRVRRAVEALDGDDTLIAFLARLKTKDNRSKLSVSMRRCFDKLFEESKRVAARILSEEAARSARLASAEYEASLLNTDRYSDGELQKKLEEKRASVRVYCPEKITEGDLEKILSSAIPTDRNGNLTPSKVSKLNDQFAGKRFSRQHISDILCGKADVTRFDIITLSFFIASQLLDEHPNAKERFTHFMSKTNEYLASCSLGKLNVSNPYECFVLMCMLSEDPLGTYADVWELSYADGPEG